MIQQQRRQQLHMLGIILLLLAPSITAWVLPSLPSSSSFYNSNQQRRLSPFSSSLSSRLAPLRQAESDKAEGVPVPFPGSTEDVRFDEPLSDPDRFIVDISIPEPTAEELAETNLVKIVKLQCKDEEVNMLAWKCLGYRYVPTEGRWDNTNVFPKWRDRYPEPPDLVGVTRNYEREVDAPVKKANTGLVRSVPKMYKQSLKELLAPYGFKGFKIAELTPNRTRRAQVCNWLLYYKRDLWGIPIEELLQKKNQVTQVTREGETPEQLGNKMVY